MFVSYRLFTLRLECSKWAKRAQNIACWQKGYQVPKSQDSFTVSHDDSSDVILRPVSQDVVDVTLVVDRDEQTLEDN